MTLVPPTSKVSVPFAAAATGTTNFFVDTPDGDPIIDYDADTGTIELQYETKVLNSNTLTAQNVTAIAALVGNGLTVAADVALGTDGTNVLGFYGTTPIARPAAPTDTATIIAALQALGLVGV